MIHLRFIIIPLLVLGYIWMLIRVVKEYNNNHNNIRFHTYGYYFYNWTGCRWVSWIFLL